MEPRIIFEDSQILVLDKPAGMVVNRAESVKGETVQDWVEGYLKIRSTKHEILNKSKITNSNVQNRLGFRNWDLEFSQRAGIVHRLDKETSGLLLVAKTPQAFENLQSQFKERQVEKKYLALVRGKIEPEEGEITAPVGRLPWNRERFGVFPGGRLASTKYKLIKDYSLFTIHYSLLELVPATGRTHQIRVHLKYWGYPVVGDLLYGGRKMVRQERRWCPRMFLHAAGIKFKHPKTKEMMVLESPLPEDLRQVLGKMIND